MNKKAAIPIIGVFLLGLVVWGIYTANQKIEQAQEKVAMEEFGRKEEERRMEEKTQRQEEAMVKLSGYSGNVLAGTITPYIEFNKADYDKVIADGKIVFLDFYANWCPICRAEASEIKAAFDSLSNEQVVGFRVNYNDGDTDEDEKALAKESGVTYQHTKVILKNGKQVLKETEQWDSKQVVEAINAALK